MHFLFFLLIPNVVFAYANFIGHGYTSCVNCHFNPFGGGQLTDYGRVVSATGISSKLIYPEAMSEEKIAYLSGFLFRKPKQNWLRTQINYRGFQLRQNPGGSEEKKSWISMQSDIRMTLKFGEQDKIIISGDYGKNPTLQNTSNHKDYISRNHYIGYRPNKNIGLYAGLMDKVYGLRVVEHIAYSRVNTKTTQNDQVHGFLGHFLNENWEAGIHAYVGNLSNTKKERLKGSSLLIERTIWDQHRLGLSYQNSRNEEYMLNSYSLTGRFNLKEGSALLFELGQANRSIIETDDTRVSRFALLQTYLRPWRGIYFLNNIEYSKNDIKIDNYSVRWGPGIQYFPMQRIELRADLYNTRNFNPDSSTPDSWMLLSQLHVWL